jgi:hypothetical protein
MASLNQCICAATLALNTQHSTTCFDLDYFQRGVQLDRSLTDLPTAAPVTVTKLPFTVHFWPSKRLQLSMDANETLQDHCKKA